MVKHTQTIRHFLLTNCLGVFDHFVGLTLKGLVITFELGRDCSYVKHCNIDDYPADNYMFKVSNRKTRTKCEICSKLTIKIPDANAVVLVSLLLTMNIFHTLF